MMKILVGVKMVPRTTTIRFAAGMNRIVRDGVPSEMNHSDRSALGIALSLQVEVGGEVVAFTMGPAQAASVLEEAGQLGADRAVHLEDLAFAGADTLATARAIAQLCKLEQPDVVFFGSVAIDGGTAQVPAQVAELGGFSLLSEVNDVEASQGGLRAHRNTEYSAEEWDLHLPAVVSVEASWGTADIGPKAHIDSSLNDSKQRVATPVPRGPIDIKVLDVNALGGDDAGYGIRGSATYVQQVVDLKSSTRSVMIKDPSSAARALLDAGAMPTESNVEKAAPQPLTQRQDRQLWAVVCDKAGGDAEMAQRGIEAIACAKQVAGNLDATVVGVVLGGSSDVVDRLTTSGADQILAVHARANTHSGQQPFGESVNADTEILVRLIEDRAPLAVIGPWTPYGRECMARTAARLSLGLTGDFIGLDLSARPGSPDTVDLVWLKPAWAGTALARVIARTPVAMGTLRPGALRNPVPFTVSEVTVERVTLGIPAGETGPILAHKTPHPSLGQSLEAAVVVCVGTRAAALMPEIRRVTQLLGWALGGTPAAVNTCLIPAHHVVDVARCSLSPNLAIGIGLTETRELEALRGATVIATIDPDVTAPIHSRSDLAIACSPEDVIEQLDTLYSLLKVPGE